MPATKSKLPHDIPRTIDLRSTPNAFQASAILFLSFVGAIVGYHAVHIGKWIAAAGGGVVGMVIATFVGGFILMFMPPQAVPTITMDEWLAKFRTWRRRLTFTASLCVCWIGLALAWHYLTLPNNTTLVVSWSVLMFVLYVVPHYYVHVLRQCRCPMCDQLFGYRGAFARYPHCCQHCRFTVNRDCEIAK
jgi:hypothetical protein